MRPAGSECLAATNYRPESLKRYRSVVEREMDHGPAPLSPASWIPIQGSRVAASRA